MSRGDNSFVIDVNIFVTAVISGKLERLITYILSNNLRIFTAVPFFEELTDVLERPRIRKRLLLPTDFYVSIIREATVPVARLPAYSGSPDPKDDYLYGIALAADATVVTKDAAQLTFDAAPVWVISWDAFKALF